MIRLLLAATAAFALATSATAQEESEGAPSPNEIVAQAEASDWKAIDAEDLLVMTLAPDRDGNERQVVIQLMPPPFSQDWVENIRTLARAGWYDGVSINRVQDNYVVQWGDPNVDNPEAEGEAKPLPEGLRVMAESEYLTSVDDIGNVDDHYPATPIDPEVAAEQARKVAEANTQLERAFSNPDATEADHETAVESFMQAMGLTRSVGVTEGDRIDMISISTTQTPRAVFGWHERDSYAEWVEIYHGWPLANREVGQWYDEDEKPVENPRLLRHVASEQGFYKDVEISEFWPVHCYGMVGVGRGYSPDTGSGAELYTVIGHAPRHLDRNIALVGRVIEGIEHLSSLPRGKGALGFYEDARKRVPIESIRVASDLPANEQPGFEYLSTDSEVFARYADARANRRDPFFIEPAGGADICNIPVPIRRVSE